MDDINYIWLLLGFGLVFWGKKLFWFFIGVIGFVFGLTTGQSLLEDKSYWVYLLIGAVCAMALLTLVKLLKNVAFGIGGFLAGAYLGNGLLTLLQVDPGNLKWLMLVVCGGLGALFMLKLFHFALILLSSGVGALLVTQSIPAEPPGNQVLFVGLIILGLIVQTRNNKQIPASI